MRYFASRFQYQILIVFSSFAKSDEQAGWRLYVSPEGDEIYVNDATYEEAATLQKVEKLLGKLRYETTAHSTHLDAA